MATIHLLMITYNRPDYTRLAVAGLLADPTEEFSLTVWDNGSAASLVEFLKSLDDPRIEQVIAHPSNAGQGVPFNEVFSRSKADLIGKVDNDCVVTAGWTRPLSEVHEEFDQVGLLGCWQYFEADLDMARAAHKVIELGRHRVLQHPWIGGSGFLMKRQHFEAFGPCPDLVSKLGFAVTLGGFTNGWYIPPLFQDHLDDALNEPLSAGPVEGVPGHQIRGSDAHRRALRWRAEMLRNIHDDPFEASYYVSLQGRARQRLRRRLLRRLA